MKIKMTDLKAGYPETREDIEAAMKAVEDVLATEDSRTKTGDPKKLKAAVAALDEATKPLADIMMDKAMEALLRKKGMIP